MRPMQDRTEGPLCVDLDGGLVATDLFWESVIALSRARPGCLPLMPVWLLKGRDHFRRQVARRVEIGAGQLLYRREVLDFLGEQSRRGRRLVLATASGEGLARTVADYLGIFDEVITYDGVSGWKREAKRRALEERFGDCGFDYLEGAAGRGSAVSAPDRASPGPAKAVSFLIAIRPHQWAKNLLLLLPVLTSHQVGNVKTIASGLVGAAAFSVTASAVYIVNDLLDLAVDREHPSKRDRPFAAGQLSIPFGLACSAVMSVVGVGAALLLPWAFVGLLLAYLLLTTAYSLYLKKMMIIDVICLAGLYSHRILAGGAATSIRVSPWLMAFSMFLFLSLAFAKRYTELILLKDREGLISGRGYLPNDLELIRSVGPASGCLCVLVLCLYINSPDVLKLYGRPAALWLVCPVLMYWILRIWFLAQRGELLDDPVLFALKDRPSFIAGALIGLVIVIATLT